MFRNRALIVKLDKSAKEKTPEAPSDPKDFENKAEIILHKLEALGTKLFIGVCIYVVLDTGRKVAVAKAQNHPEG